jgi:succinate dehydrogenase / fumarate reductase cytochrome b subunit
MAEEARGGRPLSPHLQVWRWTPTMASSILHRATGIALYGGALLLAAWFVALALGPAWFDPAAAIAGSPFGQFALFAFAWSLIYHSLNGLRHLYWDSGRGLKPATATMTSWMIFAASLVGAVAVFVAAAMIAGR